MLKKIVAALLFGLFAALYCAPGIASEKFTLFQENFGSLENWRVFKFPGKTANTKFIAHVAPGGETCLKTESSSSNGLLISKTRFDVKEFPGMRWSWMVSKAYMNGDNRDLLHDDSPMRVSVFFEFDPEKSGIVEKMKFEIAKKKYGEYPPRYALNYIWAAKEKDAGQVFDSPLTPRSKVIALQGGNTKAGRWINEEVNILEDFRKAFGKEPPPSAVIAVMNDSDKTKDKSVSYLARVEVYKPQ